MVMLRKENIYSIEKPNMARFRVKPDGNPGAVSMDWDMVAVNDLGVRDVCLN